MIKNIFFDFDGVIIDSMPVREYGFREIFKDYDSTLVDKLIEFHEINGGLSRFVKIKYFFEELLEQPIDEDGITTYANHFSTLMKTELTNKKYLIKESLAFINKNFEHFHLHIVSGSEQNELRYLCNKLEIDQYFHSIHGSPTHKNKLVQELLKRSNYDKKETILIGDSINDYEAAQSNNIQFYGYNNVALKKVNTYYLEDYGKLNTLQY